MMRLPMPRFLSAAISLLTAPLILATPCDPYFAASAARLLTMILSSIDSPSPRQPGHSAATHQRFLRRFHPALPADGTGSPDPAARHEIRTDASAPPRSSA